MNIPTEKIDTEIYIPQSKGIVTPSQFAAAMEVTEQIEAGKLPPQQRAYLDAHSLYWILVNDGANGETARILKAYDAMRKAYGSLIPLLSESNA